MKKLRKTKRYKDAVKAGEELGQFMRERRDLLEAENALKGSDAPMQLTPEMRKTLAKGISVALQFVPKTHHSHAFLSFWIDILVPEGRNK